MNRKPVMSKVIAGTVLLALSTAIVGCSTDESNSRPEPLPTSTQGVQLPGEEEGVTGAADVPTDVANDPVLRQNVAVTSCAAADGGWAAAGRAVNPGDVAVAYEITMFFTNAGGTVVGYGEAEVAVEAGQTAEWTIVDDFAVPETTMCALRGVGEKN